MVSMFDFEICFNDISDHLYIGIEKQVCSILFISSSRNGLLGAIVIVIYIYIFLLVHGFSSYLFHIK